MAEDTTANPVTGEIEIPDEIIEEYQAPSKLTEVIGVGTGLVALFLLLSLVSYSGAEVTSDRAAGPTNLMGLAGHWTAHVLLTLLGVTAYLLDAFLWITAVCLFLMRPGRIRPHSVLGMLIIGILASSAIHVALQGELFQGQSAGGFFGEVVGEFLKSLVATGGTYLISVGGTLVILLLITDVSLALVLRSSVFAVVAGASTLGHLGMRVVTAWKASKQFDRWPFAPPQGPPEQEPSQDKTEADSTKKQDDQKKPLSGAPSKSGGGVEPKIIKNGPPKSRSRKTNTAASDLEIDRAPLKGQFQLPSSDLLTSAPESQAVTEVDEQQLKAQSDRLIQILADFGVYGDVKEIHPGPVVTMFEFRPQSGTKLSKIGSLASELAMALEVMRVRVVAPIPGKNAVGFELPNKTCETVYLKEMLDDGEFASKKNKLPLALGKDINGTPYFVDLSKMPHLLVAGTTGSGKSVSINAMLLSLLYKYTPEDLRLLMVDPKMIELGIYDGIPHLLLPVVTDMSKACLALKWAVDEMERRYQLFADLGVRNLASYNKKVAKLKADHAAKSPEMKKAALKDAAFSVQEEEVVVLANAADNPEKLEKLPFIVTVVDELADLMMIAAKDVETSIARLAQKARASGIHLIIATQRPSVDVITGLIKANFPSRISFKVSSGIDSRTILGSIGAENLLGKGDMLVLPPGTSDLTRVHGAFVKDEDIHDIVNFFKAQGDPDYKEEILQPREDDQQGLLDDADKDEMYDQAVSIVAESQVCSISMLQRRLRVGYNRSARMVEIMEREGVVGPANGVNKREVLISPQ